MLSSMGCNNNKQAQVTCSVCILMHDVFPVFFPIEPSILMIFPVYFVLFLLRGRALTAQPEPSISDNRQVLLRKKEKRN